MTRESTARSRARRLGRWRRGVVAGLVAVVAIPAPAAIAARPGAGEEEAANNLSFPVVWAEGTRLTLPGEVGAPQLTEPYAGYPDQVVYLQGTAGNSWQAESMDAPSDGAGGLTDVDVSTVDWGDNLEAKSWPLGQNGQLRVETVLYRDLAEDTVFPPMDAFDMIDVDPNPDDHVELWATTGTTAPSSQATIYTECARLTIQRLLVDRTDPAVAKLQWDKATGKWVGENIVTVTPVVRTTMGAEVNAPGKVIYGFNWKMAGVTDGHYRITFYLDPACPNLNTFITGDTKLAVSEEEGAEPALAAEEEPDQGGGVAAIDGADNLSYIDVQLGNPDYAPYVEPQEPSNTTPSSTTPPSSQPPAGAPAPAVVQGSGGPGVQQRTRTRAQLTLHVQLRSHLRDRRTGRLRTRQRVRFYGSVLPRHDGGTVLIQRVRVRRIDGALRTVRTTVARVRLRKATATRSGYDITLPNISGGAYRVYLQGDEQHVATATQLMRIQIR